ncbi:LLM class flavin-dependent oxidoreductase [Streptomyces sp. NPDC048737]|uniref:LLM class flavin-dependent oxidoreductase n=1 Tax=unclassified Streptomyces TaxID=2593676 RepID=UPI00341A540B
MTRDGMAGTDGEPNPAVPRSSDDGLVSLFFPIMPGRPEYVVSFAELVQNSRLTRLWMGQSLTLDTYQLFAYLAGRGIRIPLGTAVTVMPLRHPYEAAMQARSVAALMGRPVTVGFGPGDAAFTASLRGSAYDRPLTASREYLSMVRELLDGRTVRRDGSYHVLHSRLPVIPDGHPAVEVGAGVLRAGMARAVGELADAAISWLTPLPYLRDTILPAMREGARSQDRTVPRLVSLVHFAVDRPGRDPQDLVLAATEGHLSSAHYTAMLRSAGLAADPSDPAAGAKAVVEAGLFVTGSAAEIAESITQYLSSGVDEVVLAPSGVLMRYGMEAALEDVRSVVTELGYR